MENRLEVDSSHAQVPISLKISAKKEFLQNSLQTKPSENPLELSMRLGTIFAKLRFHGLGPSGEAFLRSHLGRFLAPVGEAVFTLNYFVAQGPHADAAHPDWEDEDYRFHGWKDGDHYHVVHRDFVGTLFAEENRISVFGPDLGPECSDSLDNPLQFAANYYLPRQGILPVHASAVVREGKAYLFFGDSGVGKSTLARFCCEDLGLTALAGDQVYVSLKDGVLHAHACPTTIPELGRHNPKWDVGSYPLRAMIHLVQKRRGLEYLAFSPYEALPRFLRQVFCRPEFRQEDKMLNLAIDFLSDPSIYLGEMSYPMGVSFWEFLETEWKKRTN